MSIEPTITFKAGLCDFDTSSSPAKVRPLPTPGYIYLYTGEDELTHFCWRSRGAPLDAPELDLIMFPTDGTFTPYQATSAESQPSRKSTNGRMYVLKFSSSSERHLFWLQSGSQHPSKDPTWFSARDLKLGEIVNTLLQGEEVDVSEEMSNLPNGGGPTGGGDDATMEDVEGQGDHSASGGGAGAGFDATGGDIREEGEQSREGGGDGGRAAGSGSMDAQSIIQNFINSMPGAQGQQQQAQAKTFTTLQDLLTTKNTIPWADTVDEATANNLLAYLPPQLVTLARSAEDILDAHPLSVEQKRDILRRVLRSPQFHQSLSSLTYALRDGGLPSVAGALNIPVKDGGFIRRGGVPLGGGEAVETFLDGVKDVVKKEQEGNDGDDMDTSGQ